MTLPYRIIPPFFGPDRQPSGSMRWEELTELERHSEWIFNSPTLAIKILRKGRDFRIPKQGEFPYCKCLYPWEFY